jgi:predicted DNA-binding transcriptional regulator AlpA
MSRVIVIKEVLEHYARCSRPTLYRWVGAGLFPEPIRAGKRLVWTLESLETWLATREVGIRRRRKGCKS